LSREYRKRQGPKVLQLLGKRAYFDPRTNQGLEFGNLNEKGVDILDFLAIGGGAKLIHTTIEFEGARARTVWMSGDCGPENLAARHVIAFDRTLEHQKI
jgi:hypothetical protein